MSFCFHEYERIEKPKHQKWDYSGCEVLVAKCKCKKCGKIKEKQFIGKQVGNLFW